MELKDLIKTNLKNVSLVKASILLSSPTVFLCGGKLRKPRNKKNESYRYKLKKYLEENDKVLLSKTVIAEKFANWYKDGKYRELLTLERDIAGLSNIIVIILESAGSIAELSSFIMNKEISKKLFVILPSEYENQKSFIQNGVLEYLKKINQDNKFIFKNPVSVRRKNEYRDIESDIENALKLKIENRKTEGFKKNLHSAFVIYEMIRVYQVLTFEEIEICLNKLRLNFKKTDNRIKNLLFILEQFKWIKKSKRGTEMFFYINTKNRDVAKIEIKNFPIIDIKIKVRDFFDSNKNTEKDRLKLIQFKR